MQEHVLAPLEMTRASFADYHTLPGAAAGNLIVLGFSVPYDEAHVPLMLSAGYPTASAEDLANYLIPYFNQGQYKGYDVLPSQGQGWYDANWNWQSGYPSDISMNYSGGHNSINTCLQFFPYHQVGVAVLMNTRLDNLIPGPSACEIAFNIARITIHAPYELPATLAFYGGFALYDGFLVLMLVTIVWQTVRFKDWTDRYARAAAVKRVFYWVGNALNLLISLVLLASPSLLGPDWATVFSFRPEFSLPLLLISMGLGGLGVAKLFWIGCLAVAR